MDPNSKVLSVRPSFENVSEDSPSEEEEEAVPLEPQVKAVAEIIDDDSQDESVKGISGIQKPEEAVADVEESDNDSLF